MIASPPFEFTLGDVALLTNLLLELVRWSLVSLGSFLVVDLTNASPSFRSDSSLCSFRNSLGVFHVVVSTSSARTLVKLQVLV